jgi:hypothetical protein
METLQFGDLADCLSLPTGPKYYSQYRGVTWAYGLWKVHMQRHPGRVDVVGYYSTEKEAASVYDDELIAMGRSAHSQWK